jgi:hypothetical protein
MRLSNIIDSGLTFRVISALLMEDQDWSNCLDSIDDDVVMNLCAPVEERAAARSWLAFGVSHSCEADAEG